MTCLEIQRRLIVDRYQRSFVLPNYTPRRWWECDVFEITEAGFMREYEIKLSLSDYRADAAKVKQQWENGCPKVSHKHLSLAAREPNGPTRFYYVCPEGLLTPEIVPEWAGLIIARRRGNYGPPYSVELIEIKPAPKLHRQKVEPKVREHAESVCYWRMTKMFLHNRLDVEQPEQSPAEIEVQQTEKA